MSWYNISWYNISWYNTHTDSGSSCSTGFALRILLSLILVWGYSSSLYQPLVLNIGVGIMHGWRTYLWARAQFVYNFKEIFSHVSGNFKEQNKVFEWSIIIINYCFILLYSIHEETDESVQNFSLGIERKRPRRKPSRRLAENKNVDVTNYRVWSSS
jgi:hypothetical protein